MFGKIFTTRMKILIRDREVLFWTLFFPILLATFFYLGLSGLRNTDQFDPIQIAVIEDEAWLAEENSQFRETLNELSTGDEALFAKKDVDRSSAETLLVDNEVVAYLERGDEVGMVVTRSGFGASIVKNFLDQYMQRTATATALITADPAQAAAIIDSLGERSTWIETVAVTPNQLDPLLNYFYSLIAMSCFYGSMLGLREVSEIQANQSTVAARINIAPTRKMKHFLASSSASILLHFAQITLLLLFIRFVLGVEFGTQTPYILLTTLLGSLSGFAYGSFISSIVRAGLNAKIGILISSTMLMSFLSGMMFGNMKNLIRQHAPILHYLNPVSLITDALFSLNYFVGYERFAVNMLILAGFAICFIGLTYLFIRRPRYASI